MLDQSLLQIHNATNSQNNSFSLDNGIDILLVLATFILVGITWWKMRESNKLTRESNELVAKELEQRLKPILHFSKPLITKKNDGDYNFKGYLKNTGQVPVRNIKIRHW